MNVNLNYYKYFYEVAKYKSYTIAAKKLLISQPALSYSIKTLEHQLGVKLFIYKNKKLDLTKCGKEIFDDLTPVFNKLNEMDYKISNKKIKGILKIGVKGAYATKILPSYINDFNKDYQEIEIQIYIRNSEELYRLLEDGSIDLVIDDCKKSNNLIKSTLITNKGKSILFCDKKFYTELQKEFDDNYNKKIYIVSSNNFSHQFYNTYSNYDYTFIANSLLLIDKIKKEKCIGLTAEALIKKELTINEFVEIKSNNKLPKIDIYASYIDETNKAIIKFIDFMKMKSNIIDG